MREGIVATEETVAGIGIREPFVGDQCPRGGSKMRELGAKKLGAIE